MSLYFLPTLWIMVIFIGVYSLYDNRKSLRSKIPLYCYTLCSLAWTAGVWVCFMQFSVEASKLGLFIAEAVTPTVIPIIVAAIHRKNTGSNLGKYGLAILGILYLFFMIFHFKGYYVNVDIVNEELQFTHGNSPIYYLYLTYNVLSPFLCIAILLETAMKMNFKREWIISLAISPVFLGASCLLYLRFVNPESRLFGCFVQSAGVVILFLFITQYNIRTISNTQAANIVFTTVQTPYIFAGIQGDIFYSNASALDFFGSSMEEVRGKTLPDLFRFDGEEPGAFKRYRRDANEKDIYRAVALNNKALCYLTVMHRYDLFGELICAIIEVKDITEREQLIIQLEEERQRAEDAALAKSNFLANTSHEIRTPMNAILGMAELLLRRDIPPDAYEDVLNIKQAGSNLLSIINDILDFSKIESGKMDIASAEYLFASLLNDVVNIIRMRIAEKPILFIVNVDSRLPNKLEGDEIRFRQILLNLLSNAVKYTGEGQIALTISGEPDGDMMRFTIEVGDTGIGIRKDDMGKLFNEFVQLDTHRNMGVEGTGLGLTISRNLCRLMGGDITARSRYGEGSTFTATLPQRIKDTVPFAQVEKPETKTVLLWENREPYAASLVRSLENLSVPVRRVETPDELCQELTRGMTPGRHYPFVFVSATIAEKTLALIKSVVLRTTPVLLLNTGETTSFQNVLFIIMPANVLSIANVLNSRQLVREKASVAFTAPEAKILSVDDIKTNLIVTKGLLSLYQMDIRISTSGAEAVELARENSYDIIFMDHMMPGMDGIEATAEIRKEEQARREGGEDHSPAIIVALTANAVSGVREMFLERGFNDYLAKPIEIIKLNEIIGKWIPKHKQKITGEGQKVQ
jgi:PAS domain S-box-containing protein